MAKQFRIIFIFAFAVLFSGSAGADIYMFIDSHGVVHFTNVPTSSDYKLYIKEKPVKLDQRAGNRLFDDIIKKAQQKYGVDFSLIKAVIEVESGFDPKAVSGKGAKGLMQIMPFNFKSLAVKNPFDPAQNIMGGTLYLKRLFKRYENKLPLVLAAYNAGPEAVDKYDRIPPFKETHRYVKKVMKAYSQYKKT